MNVGVGQGPAGRVEELRDDHGNRVDEGLSLSRTIPSVHVEVSPRCWAQRIVEDAAIVVEIKVLHDVVSPGALSPGRQMIEDQDPEGPPPGETDPG